MNKNKKEMNVELALGKLKKEVIAEYLEKANSLGFDKVNFLFFNTYGSTRVTFSVEVKK